MYWKGRLVKVCPSCMKYLILLYKPVQSQPSIICHWPLWLKHKPSIMYWDWSSNMCIRGKNQRSWPFQKLDVKQCESICYSVSDWWWNRACMLHQIYITNVVESHQLVSSSCTLDVTWWLWSSGIGPHISSSKGEILLEYNVPRHNRVCHQLSSVPCHEGLLNRSTYTAGVTGYQ